MTITSIGYGTPPCTHPLSRPPCPHLLQPLVERAWPSSTHVRCHTRRGAGDIAATPRNTTEQAVATVLMIAGAMCWGLVLGTIVSNLSSLNPERDEFTATMTELNSMMKREGLSNELAVRLRLYFHQTFHLRRAKKRNELLELMSPSLKEEVAWEVSKEWVIGVWFLKGAPNAFCSRLSLQLTPAVFAPGEVLPIGPMYIINRGLSLYGGKCMGRGRTIGDDVIITSEALKLKFSALAVRSSPLAPPLAPPPSTPPGTQPTYTSAPAIAHPPPRRSRSPPVPRCLLPPCLAHA